jgi:hypothetical protein
MHCIADGKQYFITPISAINYRDEELEIPMGDGEGGHYSQVLKKVSLHCREWWYQWEIADEACSG